MRSGKDRIHAVPTNIITGFLGVGKSSAILHLLKHKPDHERWAVLVNEFGEIGVDGSLFSGQHTKQQGVFVREVPGGCMCCASGLPMQITLNQLLVSARPDRLLIEPTGLGHPKEVLQVLSGGNYREILSLQHTLTLVDARKLSDSRYTRHDTFNQQIAIADIVIGNKQDLYQAGDQEKLTAYVQQHGQSHAQVFFTQQGMITLSQLQGITSTHPVQSHHHHTAKVKSMASDVPMPASGFVKAVNAGEGFNSVGWRFAADKVFNHQKLLTLFSALQPERMKAVFITDEGLFGYNMTSDGLTETRLDQCPESRIEIISETISETLEAQLLGCIVNT